MEEFHTSPTCCSRRMHLDSGRCFTRQSTVAFGSISHFFYVMFAPAQFALGVLDTTFTSISVAYSFCAMPRSTVDTCSCSALGGFLTDFQYFLREGELGSCGRFTSCSSGYFHVLQHREVCTADASIAWTALSSCTSKPDIISCFGCLA